MFQGSCLVVPMTLCRTMVTLAHKIIRAKRGPNGGCISSGVTNLFGKTISLQNVTQQMCKQLCLTITYTPNYIIHNSFPNQPTSFYMTQWDTWQCCIPCSTPFYNLCCLAICLQQGWEMCELFLL